MARLRITFEGLCLFVEDERSVRVLLPAAVAHASGKSHMEGHHPGHVPVHHASIKHGGASKDLKDMELDLTGIGWNGNRAWLDSGNVVDVGAATRGGTIAKKHLGTGPDSIVAARIMLPPASRWEIRKDDIVAWTLGHGGPRQWSTHRVTYILDDVTIPAKLLLRKLRGTSADVEVDAGSDAEITLLVCNVPEREDDILIGPGEEAHHFQVYGELLEGTSRPLPPMVLDQDVPRYLPSSECMPKSKKSGNAEPKDGGLPPLLTLSSYNCMVAKGPPGT